MLSEIPDRPDDVAPTDVRPATGAAGPGYVLEDRSMIVETIRLFTTGVTEARLLDVKHGKRFSFSTVAGFFNDPEYLAEAVLEHAYYAKGVYFIPNELPHPILARAANRLVENVESGFLTKDHEVVRRRWLLVDLDPVRPKGIPSSDEEHELALARAREVRDWLGGRGWPAPVFADSGNGAHLCYRVDLPPNDGGIVERTLKTLAARFDDPFVTVDQAVFNPARIWKLYGTVARKGDAIEGRPLRLARLIDVPDQVEEVAP